jgi:O-antigen/teichoic acid export membrane protein
LRLIRKTLLVVGALSIVVSVGTALFARPFCTLLLGHAFDHSIPVLQRLSPLPLVYGLMNVFGTQTMLIFEMDGLFSKIMLCGAAVGVPLTLLLSSHAGAAGAAEASVILSVLIVATMFVVLHVKGLHVWREAGRQSMTLSAGSLVKPE